MPISSGTINAAWHETPFIAGHSCHRLAFTFPGLDIMTTIAYRDGIMAADSGCFNDGLYEGEVDKIWMLPAVGMLGCCGEYGAILKVVEWLMKGGEPARKPRLSRESAFAGLLVKLDGEVMHYQLGLRPLRIAADFHAIGSGREIAIGAMATGASAVRAVEIACHYDRMSMEPVRAHASISEQNGAN